MAGYFQVIATGEINLDAGTYRFGSTHDDGANIEINGVGVLAATFGTANAGEKTTGFWSEDWR